MNIKGCCCQMENMGAASSLRIACNARVSGCCPLIGRCVRRKRLRARRRTQIIRFAVPSSGHLCSFHLCSLVAEHIGAVGGMTIFATNRDYRLRAPTHRGRRLSTVIGDQTATGHRSPLLPFGGGAAEPVPDRGHHVLFARTVAA